MQTGQPRLLQAAQKILKHETIMEIINQPAFNRFGWAILDRWAINSPEKLKELENNKRITMIMILALTQQAKEMEILTSDAGLEQQRTGLTPHEILEMRGVSTELEFWHQPGGSIQLPHHRGCST